MSSNREGNSNPLQYSCLETPIDAGAWWAAVHGVTQSQTRLSNLAAAAVPPTDRGKTAICQWSRQILSQKEPAHDPEKQPH